MKTFPLPGAALLALALLHPPGLTGAEAPAATYQNPLIPGNLADPAVLLHQGVYYLYATGEVDGDNGTRVYTSTNLVHWQRGPVVFRPGLPHVWAPDVWRDPASGRFYLYYTVNQTVGVAEADGPLGPFQIVRKFFDRAIDAHLFRDDDGRLYLYYVQLPGFRIHVQPMASPTEPQGEPREILHPEADWETRAGRVTEGPWMIKHRGRYYLLYSGSGADTPDYAVGYATADSPLGPFTRAPHNPIVHRGGNVFGPGHGWRCGTLPGSGGTSTTRNAPRASSGTGSSPWTRCGLTSRAASSAAPRGTLLNRRRSWSRLRPSRPEPATRARVRAARWAASEPARSPPAARRPCNRARARPRGRSASR